jgi:hypothetical protein
MQADFMRRRNSEQLAAQETIAIQQALRDEEQSILNERINNMMAFSSGLSILQSGIAANSMKSGDAMFKAAQITGAAIATVDTITAAIQAMKDPTAVTPLQKFANYAAVVGKGLSAVAAIRSATVGGGGGVSAAAGGTVAPTGGTTSPVPVSSINAIAGAGRIELTINNPIGSAEFVQDEMVPMVIEAVNRGATGSGGQTLQVV